MASLIEAETERLILRQWRGDDRRPFAELNADPEVMEHFPETLGQSASDALADRIERLIAVRGWGFWAVELKHSGAFIGFVGLHVPSPEIPYSPCVEVGWRLARSHWGRGYATEAGRKSLQIGFEDLGLDEIVAYTSVSNLRSRAVMERLGMVLDPKTFEHPLVPPGSRLREHCGYRLSRERWVGVRG